MRAGSSSYSPPSLGFQSCTPRLRISVNEACNFDFWRNGCWPPKFGSITCLRPNKGHEGAADAGMEAYWMSP